MSSHKLLPQLLLRTPYFGYTDYSVKNIDKISRQMCSKIDQSNKFEGIVE